MAAGKRRLDPAEGRATGKAARWMEVEEEGGAGGEPGPRRTGSPRSGLAEEEPAPSRRAEVQEEVGEEEAGVPARDPESHGGDGEDDSDSDVGPMPAPAHAAASATAGPLDPEVAARRTRRRLERARRAVALEALAVARLPHQEVYEKSLMHRDVVNYVIVIPPPLDFLVTTSVDGHVKFWKKTEDGIEFVKHYRAHLGAVVAYSTSPDGSLLVTAGADKGLKIFDVGNFDMINMIKLPFAPGTVCWSFPKGQAQAWLAVSDKESGVVHVYDGRGGQEVLYTIPDMHARSVHLMRYNPRANVVISVDEGGMVEYWSPGPDAITCPPESPLVDWCLKSDTDLYAFKKAKSRPVSLTFSPTYDRFVTFGWEDRQVRLFSFRTGKLLKQLDESLTVAQETHAMASAEAQFDPMEFGRRIALERELEKKGGAGQSGTANVLFDDSGSILIYATLFGIKFVNLATNRVVCILGKAENQRFLNLALYQGAPKRKALVTLEMAASDNPALQGADTLDPMLFCTAYRRNRFYLFSRRAPEVQEARDVFNEKPTREEQTVAAMSQANLKNVLGTTAILHTTLGDIFLKLLPEFAPKAVENFVGLAKRGYYDNLIFHRIIKGFMIQTGCPFGDGTGGESMWGKDFEDEIVPELRHDRPYTLSMANAGPNTNGSQFFITTAAAPWLDGKHTIFGRVTAGMDVVHAIERVRVTKNEKPYEPIVVLGIEFR